MLIKFEVTNFKNFENTLVFNFTKTNSYKFNKECVTDGVVNKALIYGHNGTGKSNLGFAIFDLVSHLTDKNIDKDVYQHYVNANSKNDLVEFKYTFKFNKDIVEYRYIKSDLSILIAEELHINNTLFASIDRKQKSEAKINVKGAETLKKDIGDSKISILSYINKNAILDEKDEANMIFQQFLSFVNSMLFFRSLDENRYIGLEQGHSVIDSDIIEHNNVKDFETFLNDVGIKCDLDVIEILSEKILVFKFNNKIIPFFSIASSGTKSLALFYFWFQRLKENGVDFLFIDEFDAFYHHDLSVNIVKLLKTLDTQVILTTHNTSVISNELLRPDCYFLLKENDIKSLSNRTPKELREAHNIEKMYKAGSFGL
jgi:hypothetical protein